MTKVLFIAIFVSFTLVNTLDQLDLEDTENDVQPLAYVRVKRSICRDRTSSSFCKARVSYCSAKTYFLTFMRRNCAVTCGLCSATCKDNSKNCGAGIIVNECRTNREVQRNCRQTCGLCGAKQLPARRSKPKCKDKSKTCGVRLKHCRSSGWVKANCRQTCGLCGTKPRPTRRPVRRSRTRPTRKPKCMDKSDMCGHYNTSFCSSNNWMKANCRVTCGYCTPPPTKPPPTRPTKPPTYPPVLLPLVEVFIKECLAAHNEKRRKHGAAPLTWDPRLARDARKRALGIRFPWSAFRGNIQGENFGLVTSPEHSSYCGIATQTWYAEEKDYNFKRPPACYSRNLKAIRFAQVVWKSTKRIGVGIVKRSNGYWVVAHYYPPANGKWGYHYNVGNPR